MKASIQRDAAILQLHNLPIGTSADELANFLWSKIGLNMPPENIEVRNLPNGVFATATAVVTRASLADFLDRAIADQDFKGRTIVVRPKH